MSYPDFYIVGATRSATTTLHYTLADLPGVSMGAVKEPNHFLFEEGEPRFDWPIHPKVVEQLKERGAISVEAYERLFAGTPRRARKGDASPLYLHGSGVARRISEAQPTARIVVVLRHPVDRAYSHYMKAMAGRSTDPYEFADALSRQVERTRSGLPASDESPLPYVEGSLYATQLSSFIHRFGRGRVRAYRYERLSEDAASVVSDVVEWLDLPVAIDVGEVRRYNATPTSGSSWLHRTFAVASPVTRLAKRRLPAGIAMRMARLKHALLSSARTGVSPLPDVLREELFMEYFQEDVAELKRLLGWKEVWGGNQDGPKSAVSPDSQSQ